MVQVKHMGQGRDLDDEEESDGEADLPKKPEKLIEIAGHKF